MKHRERGTSSETEKLRDVIIQKRERDTQRERERNRETERER